MAYLSCAKDNEYPLLLIFNLFTLKEIESVVCPGVNNILPDNTLSISSILSFVILISLFA